MIKELTKEQKDQIPIYVDKWMKTILSTKQYSDKEITDSINDFYLSIGKSKPTKIIILDSLIQYNKYMKKNKIRISHTIYYSIRDTISNSIWNSINYSMWNSIRHSIRDSTHYSIWESIINSIWNSTHYSIYYSIRNSIDDSIHIDYSINVLQIKKLKQYKQFLNLIKKIYFVILNNNIAIICKKFKTLHLDTQHRLHGDGIKAFEFNDGVGSYFNHGTRIPDKYGRVKIKNWKAKWLLTVQNTELKRTLIREIGYEKIAKQLNSKLIHKDQNMELLEIPNADIEPMRLLKVVCPSTNSTYLLRVPPKIKYCEKARQWTLFNENEEYDFVKES